MGISSSNFGELTKVYYAYLLITYRTRFAGEIARAQKNEKLVLTTSDTDYQLLTRSYNVPTFLKFHGLHTIQVQITYHIIIYLIIG